MAAVVLCAGRDDCFMVVWLLGAVELFEVVDPLVC